MSQLSDQIRHDLESEDKCPYVRHYGQLWSSANRNDREIAEAMHRACLRLQENINQGTVAPSDLKTSIDNLREALAKHFRPKSAKLHQDPNYQEERLPGEFFQRKLIWLGIGSSASLAHFDDVIQELERHVVEFDKALKGILEETKKQEERKFRRRLLLIGVLIAGAAITVRRTG